MKKILISLALAAASTLAYADAAPKVYTGAAAVPTNVQEVEIASLFDKWNTTLATGDAAKVAGLYAVDGVLKPTVSNEVRDTPAKIQDYFVKFLKFQPVGMINYRHIHMLGADAAVDSGVYTFKLTKDGKTDDVQARYSFVYKKVNGEWKIVSHHSSAMPEIAAK